MSNVKFIRLTPNEIEILQVLITEVGELYGLKVFKRINKARTEYHFNKVGYGSFYAALKKLERENLIESSTPEKDQRKKHYKVTALGRNYFDQNMMFIQNLNSLPAT